MTWLYLAQVGDDWFPEFQRTAARSIEIEGKNVPRQLRDYENVRIWGTTDSERKRTHFDQMETGDLVFFHRNGVFFASARVGQRFVSSEVGEWVWDNPGSRLVYIISEYSEMDLSKQELWDVLGYKPTHRLQKSLVRISDNARSELLRRYSSIEGAYQELDSSESVMVEEDPEETGEQDDKAVETREHTEIQWSLIQLGIMHDYDVYVARNDRNAEYKGNRLGEGCIEELSIVGFSEAAIDIIRYIDVIWMDGDYIVKMFEVESTTSIFSGILRMTDFVVRVPNLGVEMFIAAPDDDESQVRKQMNRPTFRHIIEPAQHCSLNYVSFEDIREQYDLVQRAGPLQTIF